MSPPGSVRTGRVMANSVIDGRQAVGDGPSGCRYKLASPCCVARPVIGGANPEGSPNLLQHRTTEPVAGQQREFHIELALGGEDDRDQSEAFSLPRGRTTVTVPRLAVTAPPGESS